MIERRNILLMFSKTILWAFKKFWHEHSVNMFHLTWLPDKNTATTYSLDRNEMPVGGDPDETLPSRLPGQFWEVGSEKCNCAAVRLYNWLLHPSGDIDLIIVKAAGCPIGDFRRQLCPVQTRALFAAGRFCEAELGLLLQLCNLQSNMSVPGEESHSRGQPPGTTAYTGALVTHELLRKFITMSCHRPLYKLIEINPNLKRWV